ncbi:ssDNA-binding domain-containing protein [Desulfovibrio sp. OttesenSCG-928-G15]|nr:ssDNA-binding domain-containing protein [Desulfovibrio sp. OttesenSCG-928-G15]
MSQTPEKKNRFQISREVQEEFVNGVAETMLSLAEKAGEWKKPWTSDAPMGMPFCPMTGREYGGANMVRLMLTSIVQGHEDDRWMTFKQLQKFQEDKPDLKMKIKKGEHGVKLLRPEEITFSVDEDGKWKFHTPEELKQFAEMKEQGQEVPDIQRKILFYPFTVFNAAQVEGFPPKEQPAHTMTAIERNEFVERFIASSAIPVEHHSGDAYYKPAEDMVKMPFPDRFTGTDEYYATKLHEFYHATGHESRENRKDRQLPTLKGYAYEEMRAEMFSMLAGARLNLPMPESNSAAYIDHWNQKFSGGDVKAVFQAANEAARVLTTMRQFEAGEQPTARWFPKSEAWPELVAMQKERDAATGADFHSLPQEGSQTSEPRPVPLTFAESAAAFKETDDSVAKARLILQNPDFLNMALQQDPNAARELASLCDTLSQALHMELDMQSREEATPVPPEQQAAPSRMRM